MNEQLLQFQKTAQGISVKGNEAGIFPGVMNCLHTQVY